MLRTCYREGVLEAGCDEAGRGCLAGPVVAAAVILPSNFENSLLNDSKKLSEKARYQLRSIIEQSALAWAVEMVDNNEIDRLNILNASILAMHRALDKLQITPESIIVDGNKFKPYRQIPFACMVKGDSRFLSIAAASILAKTYRDDFIKQLHNEYPIYNWFKNKGYPTSEHRKAIQEQGICKYHRKSFTINKQQLRLFL